MKKLFNRKVKGEGHFIAVLLIMAVVCVLGVYYNSEAKDWFSTKWGTFETNTSTMFNNIAP